MKKFLLLGVAVSVLTAGCGGVNRYCKGEQAYMKAESVSPVRAPEGLTLPAANSALKVPPPSANPVAFGEKVKDAKGEEKIECLDQPPRMPPPPPPVAEPEAAKATAADAETAPPEKAPAPDQSAEPAAPQP
jgi:hypothetical protein